MLTSSAATMGGGITRRASENYVELYTERGDTLSGDYTPLFAKFGVSSTLTPTLLRNQIVDADDAVPLVFLVLVEDEGRVPAIRALHRATQKPPELVETPHDGKTFCFVGDVLLGRSIDMASLPRDLFEEFTNVTVRTVAATETAVAALPRGIADLPDAVGEGTEAVSVRACVPVPFPLLETVLAGDHTPSSLWKASMPLIRGLVHPETVQPYLDWLRVTLTRTDEDDGSAVLLGWERDVLVQTSGRALQTLKQRTLLRDFPWWNPGVQKEDRLELIVETIQRQANQARAIESA
jgi:hypothetical protein